MDTPRKPTPEPPKQAEWFRLSETASVGIEMALAMAVGAGGGLWLQNNVTHWRPWTLYIGFAIGLGAAIKAVVRTTRKYMAQLEYEEQLEREREQAESGGEGGSRGS